ETVARIARFVRETGAVRQPGRPVLRLETLEGAPGRRRMALAIVNDDMPFLVDSVSAAIGAQGLTIERLLHPIVDVSRNGEGRLQTIEVAAGDTAPMDGRLRESIIY